ncbi:MAG: hypothetical protein ACJ74M_07295 [Gaiellaceae bacterium]|jgi:hypothetical protein
MRRLLVLLVACACLVLLLTAAAAPAKRSEDCTWGASSVVVQEVNGQLVQSEPATSGCIPH